MRRLRPAIILAAILALMTGGLLKCEGSGSHPFTSLMAHRQVAQTTCPPSDSVWTNSNQFSGELYPDGVGNLDGWDYFLNNDQFNMQPTSSQTMWLEADNDFGICSYQPLTSPSSIKAYPNLELNLADPVISGTPTSPDINYFNEIQASATEAQPASAGDYQFMWDIFTTATTGSSAVEIEIITNRHEPCCTISGTSMGTATINGVAYSVHYTHALSDGHLYYSFVANTNTTSPAPHILGFMDWLNANAPTYGLTYSLSQPLENISAGWEIPDVSNGAGGQEPGFTVASYTLTLKKA
jgi:hypothetical protein